MTDQPTTTIYDVADVILERLGFMANTKLQKLCFFVQGWTLAWTGKPMFDESFEAWGSGPVCRELQEALGGNVVPDHVLTSDPRWARRGVTAEQRGIINAIIDSYGGMSGQNMVEITRKQGPWIKANAARTEGSMTKLDIEEMRRHFLAKHREKDPSTKTANPFLAALNDTGQTSASEMVKATGRLVDQMVAFRIQQDMTQADVANDLGLDVEDIDAFETQGTSPDVQFLTAYAVSIGAKLRIEFAGAA